MNFEKIYAEFSKGMNDEYYVDLAFKEVLVVPLLVDIMLSDDSSNSRWSENLLEKISAECPRIVYPYFDFISHALTKNNSLTSWNVWKIITNILVCDAENLWDKVKDKYFDALKSDSIAEFSIACDCAVKIAQAKPEAEAEIEKIMKNIDSRQFLVADEISETSLNVAKEKAELFLNRNIIPCNSAVICN